MRRAEGVKVREAREVDGAAVARGVGATNAEGGEVMVVGGRGVGWTEGGYGSGVFRGGGDFRVEDAGEDAGEDVGRGERLGRGEERYGNKGRGRVVVGKGAEETDGRWGGVAAVIKGCVSANVWCYGGRA